MGAFLAYQIMALPSAAQYGCAGRCPHLIAVAKRGDSPMARDERKPIPRRAELLAKLKDAAPRKQDYKESKAPPPSRPDPSQDAPPPDVGNRAGRPPYP
jgi:hypothetical protein